MSPNNLSVDTIGYDIGYTVLGPVFSVFCCLLLRQARKQKIKHLAFISRDGDLLLKVTEKLNAACSNPVSRIDYIYLSRISTSLAAETNLTVTSLKRAAAIRAGTCTPAALFGYYGIDAKTLINGLARYHLEPETVVTDIKTLQALLDDNEIQATINQERTRQKKLLGDYLASKNLLGNPDAAFVDIGWQGTIPQALFAAYPSAWRTTPLLTFLLGYWNPDVEAKASNCRINGIIGDSQRNNSILEAAPFQAAFLLESICRADHPTVTGFELADDGQTLPIFLANAFQNKYEKTAAELLKPVRSGILDYAARHAEHFVKMDESDDALRRSVQKRLLRISYFPKSAELALFSKLVHTEGHAKAWAKPLINDIQASIFLHPRHWLKGLESPWRAGYVYASAGSFFAFSYLVLESIRIKLPFRIRQLIEKTARQMGRVSTTP